MKDNSHSTLTLTLLHVIGLVFFLFFSSCLSLQAKTTETMFSVYEQNRKEDRGNYITEDFILLSHSLMMSEVLADVEETVLAPQLASFARSMIEVLVKKEAGNLTTMANLSYFRLLEALLAKGKMKLVDDRAEQELKLILQAKGIAKSPLMGHQIDYSRFKPRGRYTRSKGMENWFRAMTWCGSAYFPVLDSNATGITSAIADSLTARAMEMSTVISEDESLVKQYELIDNLLGKIFGNVEDLNWKDYADFDLAGEEKQTFSMKRQRFFVSVKDLGKIPVIYDGIVMVDQLEQGRTLGDVLCGMRLFPRRYSAESAAMQKMVFPDAGKYHGKNGALPFTATNAGGEIVKGFPKGNELMWFLGSEPAGEQLVDGGDNLYENYTESIKKAHNELRNQSNLAINTAMIRYWLKDGKQSPDRKLNSMLGYWTWGRYINLLFTKQSVTGGVKSMQIPKSRQAAWLEPATELYLWLKTDMQSLKNVVGGDESLGKRLDNYLELLSQLIHISGLETAGYDLTQDEVDFLNNLDKKIERLTGKKDLPIIVDVHTEPNSKKVLQEAVGFAQEVDHKMGDIVLKGALFTHYEFKQDMSNRLDDKAWIKMLLDPCPTYFTGMDKIKGKPFLEGLCDSPEEEQQIIVTLKEQVVNGSNNDEKNRALVGQQIDEILLQKVKGFTFVKKLGNSPVVIGNATPEAIITFAGMDVVFAIENNKELQIQPVDEKPTKEKS